MNATLHIYIYIYIYIYMCVCISIIIFRFTQIEMFINIYLIFHHLKPFRIP